MEPTGSPPSSALPPQGCHLTAVTRTERGGSETDVQNPGGRNRTGCGQEATFSNLLTNTKY